MRVIEQSKAARRQVNNVIAQLQGFMSPDLEAPAQETLIAAFQRVLDNRFVMLRNLHLPEASALAPLVLVGPPGIWVIYATAQKGIFRATEENWEQLNERSHKYSSGKPNLLAQALLLARAVQAELEARDLRVPDVEAALFFSNPGVHVDTTRPAARVILADAAEHFAAGLVRSPIELELEEIRDVVAVFQPAGPVVGADTPAADIRDAFTFLDEAQKKPARPAPVVKEPKPPGFLSKIKFSRKQLIVLGLLLVLNIVLLIAFAAILLITI